VIPIVKMEFKFAGSDMAQDAADDEDEQEGGTGWGIGGSIAPLGLLIITRDGEVKVIGLGEGMIREKATRARQPSTAKPEEPQSPSPKP
jgi:uncharacterized spore protein YtfJ